MIYIQIFDDDGKLSDKIYDICDGLRGWGPYINNEVTVSDMIQYEDGPMAQIVIGPISHTRPENIIRVKSSDIRTYKTNI